MMTEMRKAILPQSLGPDFNPPKPETLILSRACNADILSALSTTALRTKARHHEALNI